MPQLLPREMTVRFVGGPWDGQEREARPEDLTEFEPTWSVQVGGSEGQVTTHIYALALYEEWPDNRVRVTYAAISG